MFVTTLCLIVVSHSKQPAVYRAIGDNDKTALCSFCSLPILRDTPEQDNEVILTIGNKNKSYRCLLCALEEAVDIKADFFISTPTTRKNHRAMLSKMGGKWKVDPPSVAFTYSKGSHEGCQFRYRAVETEELYSKYLLENTVIPKATPLISLKNLLEKL